MGAIQTIRTKGEEETNEVISKIFSKIKKIPKEMIVLVISLETSRRIL